MTDGKLVYEDLDPESNSLLLKLFSTPLQTGYVKCKGCVIPEYFKEFGDRIRQMDVRDDDIYVCAFPKTGTTWTQEMVWCIANDLDFEGAKEFLPLRFPFLEGSSLFDHRKQLLENPDMDLPENLADSVNYINKLQSPRFIKTHLPFNLLPEKLQNNSTSAKMIFVGRNPRDTCISYYHHCKLLEGYQGSFEQFAELFLEGKLNFAPFFNHTKSFWQQKNNPNILFLKYEELKQDLRSAIHKTADFLGKTLDEGNVEKLLDHLSFSSMKQNRAVNYEVVIEFNKKYNAVDQKGTFMRRGLIDEWKEIMGFDLLERFEKWEEKNSKEIDSMNI